MTSAKQTQLTGVLEKSVVTSSANSYHKIWMHLLSTYISYRK